MACFIFYFIMSAISKKLIETIRRERLFPKDERLLVAVSGGIDSMVLLHLLLHLPPAIKPVVEVAHFNHRLRGAESEQDADFVKQISHDWETVGHVGSCADWSSKENLEARAREARYQFLRNKARERGIQKIVTAHQADDQAETFLIRWLQGAGLRGLAGIPFIRKDEDCLLVRPLLLVSRLEIQDYAQKFQIPFREDSSNREDSFLRNRVRALLQSLIKENPNLTYRASINSSFLRADHDELESVVDQFVSLEVKKGVGAVTCSLSAFQGLSDAIRYRVLQRMAQELTSQSEALPAEAILKMDELLNEGSQDGEPRKGLDLPGGMSFRREKRSFEFVLKS